MTSDSDPPQKPIPLHTKDPELGFTHDEPAPAYNDGGNGKRLLKTHADMRAEWRSGSHGKLRVIRHYVLWFLIGAVIGAIIGVVIGCAIRYS